MPLLSVAKSLGEHNWHCEGGTVLHILAVNHSDTSQLWVSMRSCTWKRTECVNMHVSWRKHVSCFLVGSCCLIERAAWWAGNMKVTKFGSNWSEGYYHVLKFYLSFKFSLHSHSCAFSVINNKYDPPFEKNLRTQTY